MKKDGETLRPYTYNIKRFDLTVSRHIKSASPPVCHAFITGGVVDQTRIDYLPRYSFFFFFFYPLKGVRFELCRNTILETQEKL